MDVKMKERFINHIKIDWSQIGEDSYVRHIKALNQLNQLSFNHNITFFVGENGSGKSTLIEAIAVAYGFSAEGGTRTVSYTHLRYIRVFAKNQRVCPPWSILPGEGPTFLFVDQISIL